MSVWVGRVVYGVLAGALLASLSLVASGPAGADARASTQTPAAQDLSAQALSQVPPRSSAAAALMRVPRWKQCSETDFRQAHPRFCQYRGFCKAHLEPRKSILKERKKYRRLLRNCIRWQKRKWADDDCGPALKKTPTSRWKCTFVDRFDGDELDTSKWSVMVTDATGFKGSDDCFWDDPQNVSVSGGRLNLTVRKLEEPRYCYVMGRNVDYGGGFITSHSKFVQKYGRFEFRAKFPSTKVNGQTTPGTQSALWLWPEDDTRSGGWPNSGEIDVAEYYATAPDLAIPFLHYCGLNPGSICERGFEGTSPEESTAWDCVVPEPDGRFHDYTLIWKPGKIHIKYDDETCLNTGWTSNLGTIAPFDQPFMISLTQALGYAANGVTENTALPATMQVEHVKVWR